MPFEIIDEVKRLATGNMWTAPERLCLTADGRVVDESDPAAVKLLVGKGGQITAETARSLGLLLEPGGADDAAGKQVKAPADKGLKATSDKGTGQE